MVASFGLGAQTFEQNIINFIAGKKMIILSGSSFEETWTCSASNVLKALSDEKKASDGFAR